MPFASLEPKRAGAESVDTATAARQEPEVLPAATLHLVPYSTDEVECQQPDDHSLHY